MANQVKPSMGCGYVVVVILLAAGLGLLKLAVQNYEQAGSRWQTGSVVPVLLGIGLVAGAAAYIKVARRIVRDARAEEARRVQFPAQPWKWRKAWQGPAIDSDAGTGAVGLWVFSIFWNAISFPGLWFVLREPQAQKGAYLIVLFPLVGLGLLAAAIYHTVRWRKYGRTRFVPSSLPGVIGGYLGGVIEVPARVQPEGDGRVVLKCVRREVRGSGKHRSTTDNVLWEHEEVIPRDKWLTGRDGTRIPVLFYIPPGSAATDDSDANNKVVWRLSATAATPGVDFATQFEVPVFVTGETAAAPSPDTPLLDEYAAPVLDEAALRASGVRREGDTFHFGASHLVGTRVVTAVLLLGVLGLLAAYVGRDVPGMVWAITIFFGLIIGLFALDVWCGRFELRIEAREVVVTKPRPWGTKVMRMARAEVREVRTEKSMSSGEKRFFRLSLVGAEGVDPEVPAQPGEPFAARKLRYELEKLKQQGQVTPAKLAEAGGDLFAKLKAQAKFVVPFAKHIPGQARAEAIGRLVLGAIQGK